MIQTRCITNSQSNSSMSSGLGASTQSIVSNKHQKHQQSSHSDQTQALNSISSQNASPQVQNSVKSADSVNKKSQVPNLNQAKPMRSGSGSSSVRNSGQRSQIYNQISEFSKEMEQLNKSAANLQVHELLRKNSK